MLLINIKIAPAALCPVKFVTWVLSSVRRRGTTVLRLVTKSCVCHHQSAVWISLYTLRQVLVKRDRRPKTIKSAKAKWLRSNRMQSRMLREYNILHSYRNANQLGYPKLCSRSQTKTTVFLHSGTICTCHNLDNTVHTYSSILYLSPTTTSTIQAQSLWHTETGDMGSTSRLGIQSKLPRKCHRICHLQAHDTAVCWDWVDIYLWLLLFLAAWLLSGIWVSALDICGWLPSANFSQSSLFQPRKYLIQNKTYGPPKEFHLRNDNC